MRSLILIGMMAAACSPHVETPDYEWTTDDCITACEADDESIIEECERLCTDE
jgi:hypothetical protein